MLPFWGPSLKLHVMEGGGRVNTLPVAKQAVEFAQVLASSNYIANLHILPRHNVYVYVFTPHVELHVFVCVSIAKICTCLTHGVFVMGLSLVAGGGRKT